MALVKSYLKPENSIIAGLATVGLVIADYNLHAGSMAATSASPAWDTNTTQAAKKAGYTSLILVAGISLVSRDANVFILGCAAIIAMHSSYIHSIATSPSTGNLITGAAAASPLFAAA